MFQPWPFFCLQKNYSTTELSQHISQNAQNQIFYMPPVRISKAEFFVVKSSSSTDTQRTRLQCGPLSTACSKLLSC